MLGNKKNAKRNKMITPFKMVLICSFLSLNIVCLSSQSIEEIIKPFSESEQSQIDYLITKVIESMPALLEVTPNSVVIKRDVSYVEFSYKTKAYRKPNESKAKRQEQTYRKIIGPVDDGFILRLTFERHGYPHQAITPQSFLEPYGYTLINIIAHSSKMYQIFLSYSYVHKDDEKSPYQLTVTPSRNHTERISLIYNELQMLTTDH